MSEVASDISAVRLVRPVRVPKSGKPRRGRLYPNAMGTSTPMRWVQAPHSLVFTSHSSMHRFYLSPHSRPKGLELAVRPRVILKDMRSGML